MESEAKAMLFDIAKSQDALMQNISAELGVKTTLYLVFSIFLFNAAFQINTFVKGFGLPWGDCAITFSMVGAGMALLGAIALLVAALVRNYKMFPTVETAQWILDMDKFLAQYPEENTPEHGESIREILEETIAANKRVNEKKALWITVGAWALFVAVPFVATAGLFSFLAYRASLLTALP